MGLSVVAARLLDMIESNAKADLLRSLQAARDALLWKLDGLSEYDVRRPLTPTGTNLLGLVKHVTGVELGYFGDTFGRPFFEEPPLWFTADAEPNADMWADAEESREQIVGLYRQAWKHSDTTIETFALDAIGRVAWWPEDRRGDAAPGPGARDRRHPSARGPRRHSPGVHRRGCRDVGRERRHAVGRSVVVGRSSKPTGARGAGSGRG